MGKNYFCLMDLLLYILINYIVVGVYAGLITSYWVGWSMEGSREIGTSRPDAGIGGLKDRKTMISVVIAARNEETNIRACLDSVLAQTYPSALYEVIVVDDHSTDATAEIIRSYPRVNLILLKDIVTEELNSYKKKAIETGVGVASGELIVSTDADCIVPDGWLSSIANLYETKHPVFIAAPVAYHKEKNFLQIFQSLDFMSLQGITGGAINKRMHYMCNGANLAYKRSVFYEAGGFAGIDSVASGDDMLLMQKISKLYPKKIAFLRSRSAIVETAAASSVKAFLNQRIRWASKADKYPDKKMTWILIFVYLFNLYIFVSFVLAFIYPREWIMFTILMMGKIATEMIFLIPVSRFFQKQKLLWWFPISQPFHIIYTLIAGWLGKFGSYTWKERRVK